MMKTERDKVKKKVWEKPGFKVLDFNKTYGSKQGAINPESTSYTGFS